MVGCSSCMKFPVIVSWWFVSAEQFGIDPTKTICDPCWHLQEFHIWWQSLLCLVPWHQMPNQLCSGQTIYQNLSFLDTLTVSELPSCKSASETESFFIFLIFLDCFVSRMWPSASIAILFLHPVPLNQFLPSITSEHHHILLHHWLNPLILKSVGNPCDFFG